MEKFNTWLANKISMVVATMWCFYVFNLLSAPAVIQAFQTHNIIIIINAVSSNWLQLVLLPAIMVYQKIQGDRSEKRAEQDHKMIKSEFTALKLIHADIKLDIAANAELLQLLREDITNDKVMMEKLDHLDGGMEDFLP